MRKYFATIILMSALFAVVFTSCDEILNITRYTVTFDSNGGTPTPQPQTVKEGDRVSKPADPASEGYDFVGWAKSTNASSALWDFETETVNSDMTLYARWAITSHLVTFDSDGGTAVPSQNIAHGGRATKPADPTRSGYEFDGWFNATSEWDFSTAITVSITLKARWTAVHTVTFDSDGGSSVASQSVRNGNTATKPEPDPTRDGYEFDGWFNGETEWNFSTPVTVSITLKAKWTAAHVVTFDSDGGSTVPFQIVRNGATVTKPADPTKTIASGLYLGTLSNDYNYTFTGWYNGETLWDFNNNTVTASITLKAKWSIAVNPTRIESVLPNDISGAVTYVNANSNSGEEYTLLIGVNVTAGVQTLNAANAKLTIIGIGAERTITRSTYTYNPLFTINGNNVTSLTLGQNITITESYICVRIDRGNLTMHDGSKITEANSNAVVVSGINSFFKMEGGEISGNYNGVSVENGATFEVSGGVITGSTTSYGGDVLIGYNCTFLLSGNTRIGSLILSANNATTHSSVTINGAYSGTVTRLYLYGNYSSTNTVANWWTNASVIVNANANIITMFNNGLGDFADYSYRTQPIYTTHILNATGYLILKE